MHLALGLVFSDARPLWARPQDVLRQQVELQRLVDRFSRVRLEQ